MASHTSSEILALVPRIDAVFGLYYWLMHFWLDLAGINPLTLRLPSAIAVGIGAAAVTGIGIKLQGRKLGLTAGLVFALLPRMTAMGIEARSYAMCAALVAVLGWLLLSILEKPRLLTTSLYLIAGIGAVYLHMYAVLAVGSLWLTGMFLASSRRSRIVLSAATAGILTSTVPLFLVARTQAGAQISWIDTTPRQLLTQVLVEQYFPYKTVVRFTTPDQEWVRTVAVILAAAAGLLIVATLIRDRKRLQRSILFAIPGVALPTVAVLTYSVVVSPAYTPKYLIATVPAFAVLLAMALISLPRLWLKLVAIALLAGFVAPIYLAQRQPYGKFIVDDYAFIADTISRNSLQGDAIVFDEGPADPVDSGRNSLSGYPEAFRTVRDVAEVNSSQGLTTPWSPQLPFNEIREELARSSRVWLVTTPQKITDPTGNTTQLEGLGFHQSSRHIGPTHEIILWTKSN